MQIAVDKLLLLLLLYGALANKKHSKLQLAPGNQHAQSAAVEEQLLL
jgi:hypothetical protein